jgi:hypothetical protein
MQCYQRVLCIGYQTKLQATCGIPSEDTVRECLLDLEDLRLSTLDSLNMLR